jgi:hypothetical protein
MGNGDVFRRTEQRQHRQNAGSHILGDTAAIEDTLMQVMLACSIAQEARLVAAHRVEEGIAARHRAAELRKQAKQHRNLAGSR